MTKSAVVQIDATPFRQWYENHYGATLGKKKGGAHAAHAAEVADAKRSRKVERKLAARSGAAAIESAVDLNSVLVDYTLSFLQDQVNLVDVMVTSWKVKN